MDKKTKIAPFGKKDYWSDVLSVSVLISLSLIGGCVNYISDGDKLNFGNVFLSLLALAAWALWGCAVLSRRRPTHPTRILYTVWFVLPAAASFVLLVMSLITSSGQFVSGGAGAVFAAVMLAFCLPLYGLCFFGSSGYIANDILMFLISVLWIFLPYIAARVRADRTVKNVYRRPGK